MVAYDPSPHSVTFRVSPKDHCHPDKLVPIVQVTLYTENTQWCVSLCGWGSGPIHLYDKLKLCTKYMGLVHLCSIV